jgi:hypothetical protein
MGGPLLFLVACLALSLSAAQVNDRPIIGVYTQPSDSDLLQYGEQFIAASYVKFIEGAGARVAPIRFVMHLHTLTQLIILLILSSITSPL